MKTSRRLIVVVALALIGFGGLAGAGAAGALKGRPTAIAVCDVQSVFNALQEKAAIEADLQTTADKIKAEDTTRQTKLKEMQDDLTILAPGGKDFAAKQDELEEGALGLQAWREFQARKLNRERSLQIENLYRKMVDEVSQVAKQNGYDVVMFKEPAINFKADKPEQLSTLIQVRKVLWSADDLDVTQQVTDQMNNKFKQNVPAPAPAAKP